jgi:hypothetical protein
MLTATILTTLSFFFVEDSRPAAAPRKEGGLVVPALPSVRCVDCNPRSRVELAEHFKYSRTGISPDLVETAPHGVDSAVDPDLLWVIFVSTTPPTWVWLGSLHTRSQSPLLRFLAFLRTNSNPDTSSLGGIFGGGRSGDGGCE